MVLRTRRKCRRGDVDEQNFEETKRTVLTLTSPTNEDFDE